MSVSYYDLVAQEREQKEDLSDTEFWDSLMSGVYGQRAGDAKLIIDAEDSEKGCGKTGLAVFLAKILSGVFDYDFSEEDMTLSGAEYLRRVREHPGEEQPSVIILDELAGAGAGHAYREMSGQNVELGNWWQLMRKKRIVTLATVPHWGKVSKSMRREAEYRLHCLKEPIGYFKAYEVTTSFAEGDIRTRGLDDERIGFPDMPSRNDRHYNYLDERKDRLLASATTDADALHEDEQPKRVDPEEIREDERKKTRVEIAQSMRNTGLSGREVADIIDCSHTWVYENTVNPDA
ncbi:hypothetical protein NDI54_20935 [Haloarcula sp. S1AR25-5A]|uniref:Uncharacterized protein n=1 Tax=Haloarcula terrestris TaxID=2950533 RepID=A0AAE4F1F5_9EURY|nr:hypothetical protein [Haloarcula terrestris]MDS0223797.1 hypothetical protein [Haloarcula terrestris]